MNDTTDWQFILHPCTVSLPFRPCPNIIICARLNGKTLFFPDTTNEQDGVRHCPFPSFTLLGKHFFLIIVSDWTDFSVMILMSVILMFIKMMNVLGFSVVAVQQVFATRSHPLFFFVSPVVLMRSLCPKRSVHHRPKRDIWIVFYLNHFD